MSVELNKVADGLQRSPTMMIFKEPEDKVVTIEGNHAQNLLNRQQTRGRYMGGFFQGKRHGMGEILRKGGVRLKGEWNANVLDGKAIQERPDGSVFECTYSKGIVQPECVLKTSNGDVFTGSWFPEEDDFRGDVHCCYKDGSEYRGKMKLRLPHGLGEMTKRGMVKRCEWDEGVPAGIVTETSLDGHEIYRYQAGEGIRDVVLSLRDKLLISGKYDFENKSFIDKVEVEYKNEGALYSGTWDSKTHTPFGVGQKTYVDRSFYYGQWQTGLRSGFGTMSYADGKIYRGDWSLDLQHGKGIETSPNGKEISGTWNEGVKSKCC